ncbi:MAG: histidine kinase [Candidatus Pacebacteria bacterium]|jgi:hypothetical protein|nr:histidine kinase [Candidatus Paceibacterota bacterium]
MTEYLSTFANSAKDLSRNPLGIIALFIVLVYGFVCLLFGFSADSLQSEERTPLVWFVVLFPVLVLLLFGWLVSRHHDKLYAPSDYRDDKSFLATLQQATLNKAQGFSDNEKNVNELMEYGKDFEIIADQERRIEADLSAKNMNFSGDTSKVLIRHLAAAQVINWFETNYNTIFGSQIALLRKLQGSEEGINLEDIDKYFNDVKAEYPEIYKTWDTKQYLAYLKDTRVIEEIKQRIKITRIGVEFLKLLSASGYTERKAL